MNERVDLRTRQKKIAATESRRETEIASRMTIGTLLELTGLPKAAPKPSADVPSEKGDDEESQEKKDGIESSENLKDAKESPKDRIRDENQNTVVNLKEWLNEKLESSIQIAWIDIEPAANKAIVRFKEANIAENALTKLTQAFDDGQITYKDSKLTGRVLTGAEEISFWTSLLAVLQAKRKKGGHHGGRGGSRFGNKRRRVN